MLYSVLSYFSIKKKKICTEKSEVLCPSHCLISHRSLVWKEAPGIHWSYPIPCLQQGTTLKLHQISNTDNISQDHINSSVNTSMVKDYINSLSNSFKYWITLMQGLLFLISDWKFPCSSSLPHELSLWTSKKNSDPSSLYHNIRQSKGILSEF